MKELPPFLESLAKGPMVFDGAVGTILYERGVYLNKSFEQVCILQPDLVEEIHREYIDIGVDIIQTNTYSANTISLAGHNLADQADQICQAAVQIAKRAASNRAYIAGSIGPTGLLPKDLIRGSSRKKAFDAFRQQVRALVDSGVDLLSFETFSYLGELELAIEAAYGIDVPIIAQASFSENHQTLDGASVEEVTQRILELGVDIIGANCVLGPERLLEIIEPMIASGKPVIMQPNAGQPRVVHGRAIYQSSPETFGVIARRAFKKGVHIVGGCCGTNREHMRRVVAAGRMMGSGRWRDSSHQEIRTTRTKEPSVPLAKRSALGQKMSEGSFTTLVEISPPTGLDSTKVLEKIAYLKDHGVDAVNIPDGPRATVRMSNIAMARIILDNSDMEPLVHFCARDRNLLGLQSDLLGAHALGIRNLVVITGDPPKVGDYPDASAVFDLDSIGMLSMAAGLNSGLDPAGKSIHGSTSFVLGTGCEPAALDFDREIRRLKEKKEAGADMVMTQPVYDPAVFTRFLEAIQPLGLPILVGILPLASARNAEFLHQNVPGMRVPKEVRDRMNQAGDKGIREGINIAIESLQAIKPLVQGAYIMPPFGRVESAAEIISAL
jgi:methionine synthase / methylenetetrahydrofolate reductase(NADPH)